MCSQISSTRFSLPSYVPWWKSHQWYITYCQLNDRLYLGVLSCFVPLWIWFLRQDPVQDIAWHSTTQSPQSLPGPGQFHWAPWSFLTLIVLRTGQRFCWILLWLIMSDISLQLDSSYKWIVFSELYNLTVVLCCPVMPVYFNLSSLKFLQIHTLSCYVPPMTHFIFF